MGLLDEAIRQHLELKRQHGASDEELQMQEQEALGPVRREPVEPTPPAAPEDAEPTFDHALGEQAGQAPEDAGAVEPSGIEEAPLEPLTDAPVYDEPPLDPADEAPAYQESTLEPADEAEEYDESIAEPAAGASTEPPPEAFHEPVEPFSEPAPEDDAATEVFRAEEGFAADEGGDTPSRGFEPVEEAAIEDVASPDDLEDEEEEEDVLEETPEFLQETPEHDRLWFEQKPPRDFDFDE